MQHHHAAGASPLAHPLGLSSLRAYNVPSAAVRAAIEAEVDLLITWLDDLDGDADAEPSLGSGEWHPEPATYLGPGRFPYPHQHFWAEAPTDDREDDAGDDREREDEHGGNVEDDGERTLGWPEGVDWADDGATTGAQPPEGECEPSLGWTTGGAIGDRQDREDDGRDMEPDLGWEAGSIPYDQTHLRATDFEDDNDTGFADDAATRDPSLPIFPETRRRTDEELRQEREIFDAARRLAWTRMGRNPDTVSLLGPGLAIWGGR